MGPAADKVFIQAWNLWGPEKIGLRIQFESEFNALDRILASTGPYDDGTRVVKHGEIAAKFIDASANKILDSLLEAHEVVGRRRNRKWSNSTFSQWCQVRLKEVAGRAEMEETWRTQRLPSKEYLEMIGTAKQLATLRFLARLNQHFSTNTEHWLWYYGKHLKSVPGAWWVAIAGWLMAGASTFWPPFGSALRSILGLQ